LAPSQRPSLPEQTNTKPPPPFEKNAEKPSLSPKKAKLPSLITKNSTRLPPIENISKKRNIQSIIQRFAKGETLNSNEQKLLEEKGLGQT